MASQEKAVNSYWEGLIAAKAVSDCLDCMGIARENFSAKLDARQKRNPIRVIYI